MWDNWKHFCAALFKHIEDSLYGKEPIWILLLTDSLKEDGQVVVVVKGHDVDLPEDSVLRTVVNANGQITSVIEATEFRSWHWSSVNCSSFRFKWLRSFGSLGCGKRFAANALTFLEC